MGRSGNLLGPQYDRSSIQEVFTDHDAEMLIVQPDPSARGRAWRRTTAAPAGATTTAMPQLQQQQQQSMSSPAGAAAPPQIAGASRMEAAAGTATTMPPVSHSHPPAAEAEAAAVRVPVYWQVRNHLVRRLWICMRRQPWNCVLLILLFRQHVGALCFRTTTD
jgi:hypothetical protein